MTNTSPEIDEKALAEANIRAYEAAKAQPAAGMVAKAVQAIVDALDVRLIKKAADAVLLNGAEERGIIYEAIVAIRDDLAKAVLSTLPVIQPAGELVERLRTLLKDTADAMIREMEGLKQRSYVSFDTVDLCLEIARKYMVAPAVDAHYECESAIKEMAIEIGRPLVATSFPGPEAHKLTPDEYAFVIGRAVILDELDLLPPRFVQDLDVAERDIAAGRISEYQFDPYGGLLEALREIRSGIFYFMTRNVATPEKAVAKLGEVKEQLTVAIQQAEQQEGNGE